MVALEGPVNSLVGHGLFLFYHVDYLGSSLCRIAFCSQLWPGCGASWCPLVLLLWLVSELAPLPFLFAAGPGLWVARWRVRGCT